MNIKKNTLITILAALCAVFLLSSCDKDATTVGRPIPPNTEGSFNFLNDNGRGGIVVIDQKGNIAKPVDRSIIKDGKLKLERTLKFYKVNPCYVEVCPSVGLCEVYKISDGPCPPGF